MKSRKSMKGSRGGGYQPSAPPPNAVQPSAAQPAPAHAPQFSNPYAPPHAYSPAGGYGAPYSAPPGSSTHAAYPAPAQPAYSPYGNAPHGTAYPQQYQSQQNLHHTHPQQAAQLSVPSVSANYYGQNAPTVSTAHYPSESAHSYGQRPPAAHSGHFQASSAGHGAWPSSHGAPPSGYPHSGGAYGGNDLHAASNSKQHMARSAFRQFDRDASGFLDVAEFVEALNTLGVRITFDDAMVVFALVDDNRNGRISEAEFVAHYLANY